MVIGDEFGRGKGGNETEMDPAVTPPAVPIPPAKAPKFSFLLALNSFFKAKYFFLYIFCVFLEILED